MRVQVNVSDEMVSAIDDISKMLGVSRSSLCSIWIGQGKMNFDKAFFIADNYELESEEF